ncbi:beta-N-acetylhexosaminidase [bacterium]|nr:MAG: beta-N-acetylhexosaminidase [bacterium]
MVDAVAALEGDDLQISLQRSGARDRGADAAAIVFGAAAVTSHQRHGASQRESPSNLHSLAGIIAQSVREMSGAIRYRPSVIPLLLPMAMVQSSDKIGLVPRPTSVIVKPEEASLSVGATFSASKGLKDESEALQRALSYFELKPATDGKGAITLTLDEKLVELGEEGYRLSVQPDKIHVRAYRPAGVFYGIQTLRQLFPPGFYVNTIAGPKQIVMGSFHGIIGLPQVEIEDKPRFSWRGMHLDVARHFMPKESILRFLDLMAIHKLNTFHWHLTDDQGWRLESKRYPKLTSIGAWRKDTMQTYSPPTYSGKPHGGFYTQQDAREIVAYAKARHIDVVPEIEMPGHAQAAIAAYPELGNVKQPLEVFTDWGVNPNVFNVEDGTVKFLQNVLDEVLAIFPSKFIHVGGDEVPKEQWKTSPSMQAKIKKLGLKDEAELQSWLIHQMDGYLAKKGRRLIGWDEILEGGLAPGATVMSWRGIEGGVAAAKAGHDFVMAANQSLYFDYYQSKDREKEPRAIGGYVPIEKVYSFEPVPTGLTPEEAKHALGVQAQLWTEYIPDYKQVEYMAYPRGAALAEIAWSPAQGKDYADFSNRLKIHVERLRALGVNFRPLDTPMVSDGAWKSGEVGANYQTLTWTIARPLQPGVYEALFSYTGGAHRLDIALVEARQGQQVLARDVHDGQTGGENVRNRYRLDLSKLTPGEPITLRARVRADGGNDSAGEVFLLGL